GWARKGLSNKQIAQNMGIHQATFYKWQNKYSEIYDTIKKGKEVVDYEVENTLLKCALGFEYEETKVNSDGTTIKYIKHVKPNVTAIIFWLKNRKPNEWLEGYQDDSNINYNIDFSDVSTEDLRNCINENGGTYNEN
ncbi:helix-turn-helix domain-containing protein, partial [Staphylococcus epidermidis]